MAGVRKPLLAVRRIALAVLIGVASLIIRAHAASAEVPSVASCIGIGVSALAQTGAAAVGGAASSGAILARPLGLNVVSVEANVHGTSTCPL